MVGTRDQAETARRPGRPRVCCDRACDAHHRLVNLCDVPLASQGRRCEMKRDLASYLLLREHCILKKKGEKVTLDRVFHRASTLHFFLLLPGCQTQTQVQVPSSSFFSPEKSKKDLRRSAGPTRPRPHPH
jgi:hypothetical protein